MQEKKWDWKDAPEWATHVGVCQYYSSEYVLWYDEDNYLYHQNWDLGQQRLGVDVFTKDMLIYTETRPEPKENLWDGEGIPSNGTIFNANFEGKQYKVKVICQPVDEDQVDKVVAVVGLEGERKCLLWWTNNYQKIKTKEEIEAEKERSRVCDKIYGVLLTTDGKDGSRIGNRSDYAEALYDAGLRFVDKIN